MSEDIKTVFPSIRDQALIYYDEVKNGELVEAGKWLANTVRDLHDTKASVLDRAFYLWVLGEYVNRSGENTLLSEHRPFIDISIEAICEQWNTPMPHWLDGAGDGFYLSHIAICYAALRSISYVMRSDSAQKISKEIREEAFASYLRGTHFVSRKHPDEVAPDVVAAAVPFGLITPGDLALLKAVDQLNDTQFDAQQASLMAIYNLESGKSAQARECCQLALQKAGEEKGTAAGNNDSAETGLLTVAKRQLERGWAGDKASDGSGVSIPVVRFVHEPYGNDSPYIVGWNERTPRQVTAGQPVIIRTFAESRAELLSVQIEYLVDEEAVKAVDMIAAQSPEGDDYWEGTLPAFSSDARQIRYRFIGYPEGEEAVHSEWYAFPLLGWVGINQVISIEKEEGVLRIHLQSDEASTNSSPLGSVLTLTENGEGTVSFDLSFSSTSSLEQNSESESKLESVPVPHNISSEQVDGKYTVGQIQLQVIHGVLELTRYGAGKPPGSVLGTEPGSPKKRPLLQALVDADGHAYKVSLQLDLQEEERLYGMGERFAKLEYRGYDLDNYVFNQYKDQGFRTYIPIPFLLSSAGYGLFLQSSLYSIFRLGTVTPDLMQIEADVSSANPSLTWHFFSGKPLDIITQYTACSGRPKLPPKWAFGPWMSSNNWDSQEEVDRQLELSDQYGIPSTVIVLEQWSDEATFYIFNDAQYDGKPGEERFVYDDFVFPEWGRWPNPKGMVEQIHDRGLKLLLWQAPVMKFMEGQSHPQRDRDEQVMKEKQYGVLDASGEPYRIPEYEWFRGSMVPDFTRPEAAAWWFSKRQYLLDEIGIDGFKTDGGECIYGSGAQFADGRDGSAMRNEYPNVYIRAFHEFANEHVEGGAITFSRAGYTGAQTMPLHWAGDEKSTFEAFRASITAGLTSGLSGLPFWGWDLGGFSGEIPSAELYIRSAQMAAFCPVMQYHAESKGEFNMDRTPWNIAERRQEPQALTNYKTYADLRMNLLPYIYDQAIRSSQNGHPLMRAMMLDYPDDPKCSELSLQYMFGEHLLVAPITEEGAWETEVYFPEGSWLSLFGTDLRLGGQSAVISAELNEIPVYIRSNGVVPLHLPDDLQLTGHVGNRLDGYERLCLMIYLTDRIDGTVFQDDLECRVTMNAERTGEGAELNVTVQGDYPVTLIIRGLGAITAVAADDVPLTEITLLTLDDNDSYSIRNDELHVLVQPGTRSISIA